MRFLDLSSDILINIFCQLYGFDYVIEENEAIRLYERVSPFVHTCRRVCDVYFLSLRTFRQVYKLEVDPDYRKKGSSCDVLKTTFCTNFILDALIYSPYNEYLLLPKLFPETMARVKQAISERRPGLKHFKFYESFLNRCPASLCVTSLNQLKRLDISEPKQETVIVLAAVPRSLQHLSLREVTHDLKEKIGIALVAMKANLTSIEVYFKDRLIYTLDNDERKLLMYVDADERSTVTGARRNRVVHELARYSLLNRTCRNFSVSRDVENVCFKSTRAAEKLFYSFRKDINRWYYLSSQSVGDRQCYPVGRLEYDVGIAKQDKESAMKDIQSYLNKTFNYKFVLKDGLRRIATSQLHPNRCDQRVPDLRHTFDAVDISTLFHHNSVLSEHNDLRDIQALEVGSVRQLWSHETELNIALRIDQLDVSKMQNLTVLRLADPEFVIPFPAADMVYAHHLRMVKRIIQTGRLFQYVDIHGDFLTSIVQKNDIDSIFESLSQLQTLNIYGILSSRKVRINVGLVWESTPFLSTVNKLLASLEKYCQQLKVIKLWDRPDPCDQGMIGVEKNLLDLALRDISKFDADHPDVDVRGFFECLLSWRKQMNDKPPSSEIKEAEMIINLKFSHTN